jgi:hypothetical protein
MACFRGRVNFTAELNRLADQGQRNQKAVALVREDRRCEAWYPYLEGFNPMDHFLWYQEQEREKERRAFEERLSKRAEDLQTSLALRDEQLQTQRDQAATSTNTVITRLTVLAVILAAAQVLTMTQESLLAKIALGIWRFLCGLLR